MALRLSVIAFACLLVFVHSTGAAAANIAVGDAAAPQRGVYEIRLTADSAIANPYFDAGFKVTFTRPDSSTVVVDGFYDGDEHGKPAFKARAYCVQAGAWKWTSSSTLSGLDGRAGAFTVVPSGLPGKLRKHPADHRQFAYDNGDWFLHIGDTGYRYVVDSEPEWQAYIDQAARMGATKIRTWFCRSRSGVEALFIDGRAELNLPYWQEIDRRVQYALNHYAHVILQLIPYGEDAQEVLRYGRGDRMSRLVAQYAQARFSAFPNVTWCVSNDFQLAGDDQQVSGRGVPASVIDTIARDMAAREPWGTLLTNHQARYSGYAFTDAPWSDITTIEDLDQVDGRLVLEYRAKTDDPVIIEEDRYELHETPEHPRYFFRRLMWASLLSGGSTTYGGARTYEAYNGRECGVRGYYDLNREGILRGGADDFIHIHDFFKRVELTLVGMSPADSIAGSTPAAAKAMAGEKAVIVYIPNPDAPDPEKADAAKTNAACRLQLPAGNWRLRWFETTTGHWFDNAAPDASGGDVPLTATAPFTGDAVLLAVRR